jgi:hypothetical protein
VTGEGRAASEPTGAIAAGPANTARPTITGRPQEGQTLTAGEGTWTSPDGSPITFAYQWKRCDASGEACQNIAAATQKTYTAQPADVGITLVVTVTATNGQGSQSRDSLPTPVVTGLPAGATIPVDRVSLPDQLVVSAYQFQPSVLTSRAPFTVRFRVSDTPGRFVSGGQVSLIVVPYGRVVQPGTATTDGNGWATFTLVPTSRFPLVKGYLITVQARAVKPGDTPYTHGVTAWRLVSVRINPSA